MFGPAGSVPKFLQQSKQALGAARFHVALHLQHDPQLLGKKYKAAVFGFYTLGDHAPASMPPKRMAISIYAPCKCPVFT